MILKKEKIENSDFLKVTDNELILLYENMSRFIYENEDKYNYECISSGVSNKSFDFTIKMKKNEKLPEKLLNIFFIGLNIKYIVSCKPLPNFLQTERNDYYIFKVNY